MLIGADGRFTDSGECPACGAEEKNIETFKGFGGYTQKICKVCAHVIEESRELPARLKEQEAP